MTRELPQFLRDLIATPPRAGEGVHAWLFRVSRQLHAHLPAVEIIALLESRVRDCGRHVPRTEIENAVKNSIGCAWQPTVDRSRAPASKAPAKWPAVNQEQRAAIIRDGGGLADLWELSRVRLEDNLQHTEEIIDQLSPATRFCAVAGRVQLSTQSRVKSGAGTWRGCN